MILLGIVALFAQEPVGPDKPQGADNAEGPPAAPQEVPRELAGRILPVSEVQPNFTALLTGQRPAYNVRQTVAVGDTMFTAYSYTVSVAASLPQGLNVGGGREDTHTVSATEPLTIQDIFLPTIVACSTNVTRVARNGHQGSSCLIDQDRDGRFERIRREAPIQGGSIHLSPIEYAFVPDRLETINFRYELVYLGRSGQTLRIAYREFSNEMARPAFSNELTFDIAPTGPTVFRYRDLRVTVFTINNEGVSFEIDRAGN